MEKQKEEQWWKDNTPRELTECECYLIKVKKLSGICLYCLKRNYIRKWRLPKKVVKGLTSACDDVLRGNYIELKKEGSNSSQP